MDNRIEVIDITDLAYIATDDVGDRMAKKAYLVPSKICGIAIFDEFIGISISGESPCSLKNTPFVMSILDKYFTIFDL